MRYVAGMGMANCDMLYSGLPFLPEEGSELYAKGFDMQLGGGTPVVMAKLAQLGVPTYLFTFLGNDVFSEFVRKELDKTGIRYQNLYEGSGIPVCVTNVMITPEDRTFVSYFDPCDISKEMEERAYQILKDASLIRMHVGMPDVYRRSRKTNPDQILVLDIEWNENMSLEAYEESLTIADYFTPNSKEAMKLTGTDSPGEAIAVLAKYFETPIVKLGKEGCMVRKNGATEIIPPLPGVKSVDATGAGDAFIAGFLYGLYHQHSIEECITFGNVMGGKCVENIGCLSGILTEEQLLSEAKKITGE